MAKQTDIGNLSRETLFALGGFLGGALIVGIGAFFVSGSQSTPAVHPLRESAITGSNQYQFIDPLIGVSTMQTDAPQYAALEQSVSAYLAQQQSKGLADASVRFGDISSAQGFTVNPKTFYSPASLYKVPIMLAYYKLAETDPSVLNRWLVYTGIQDLNADENIPSPVKLQPGAGYSIEQLIEHMIEYSDNNAAQMLIDNLSAIGHTGALGGVLGDLGVPYGTPNDFLSVGTYSIFFRVLYNATYLTPDYSEKALALLDKTDFSQGIESGVPNNVQVAHKFGDSNELDQSGTPSGHELHDCGLVYYPGHPYLLCIMTKGTDIPTLESVIAGVSKIVYQDMEQRYPASAN
jgi:beta-lactamase class A